MFATLDQDWFYMGITTTLIVTFILPLHYCNVTLPHVRS
jgi:hypothetical protein